jgi:glycogen(starch) synthase
MQVVLFSWEYPPRIVGRLAEYVNSLAVQLAKNHVETYVVTYHDSITGPSQDTNGVTTIRVSNPVHTHIGVLTWDLTLNQEIERAAANIYYQAGKDIDLIDVYDWHFIPAAVTLKNALNIPFVYSVESLEDHRAPATNTAFNMAIRGIEWLGLYEAAHITAKSEWMQKEITRIYQVPKEKITIVTPTSTTWIKNILEVYKTVREGAKT